MIDYKIIENKANEIAKKHIEIIESECSKVCERFHCYPKDLIIEYHANTQIKIKVQASHFEITNTFIFDDGIIRNEAYLLKEKEWTIKKT